MRNAYWFLLAAGWLATGAAMAQQPTTGPAWELREGGRWLKVTEPLAPPIQDATLDHVEEMIKARQAVPAKRIVVAWLKLNKQHPLRDRGLYLLGQANFIKGDRIMAFYNFDELLDTYPGSRYFFPALERQYEIADQYLRGYKNRFLGMPILDATTEATEMLYRIQQRAPGSPLAEKALLRAADYYYASSDFDLAADAYAAYVKSYPRSPLIPRVRLRQAFSALAQFRGVKFDATPVIDARQQLLDLAAAHPTIADEENIPAIIRRIDAALAKKIWETADFYRRTDKPDAEAFYLDYLIKSFPQSPESQAAGERLARRTRPAPAASPATQESR